jgi:hypothetical protein
LNAHGGWNVQGSRVCSQGSQQGNNGGIWRSQGDAREGQITLLYKSGQSETLPYRVSQDPRDRSGYGPAVTIGPTKYQKSGPGNCR